MTTSSPTGSYVIWLPDNVTEEVDGIVTSYWIPNKRIALQLSSHARLSGPQVSATTRLKDRITLENLSEVEYVSIGPVGPQKAGLTFMDNQGIQWFYLYLTWPDFAMFIKISGPPDELADRSLWPFAAVRSIRRLEFQPDE